MNVSKLRRYFICAAAVAATTVWAGPAKSAGKPGDKTPHVLLVVGDSLSAEYGLVRGQGWVALLQARLKRDAPDWKVVNASISGDTTAGGRARLPGLLRQQRPAVVIIELGGNDALRGLPLAGTQANLQNMVQAAKAEGAKVVLLGMQVPPNYGQRYTQDFAAIYRAVADTEKVAVLPFFLSGIADVPDAATMFQADRIHPKAQAHPRMLENVWPLIKPLVK